MKRQPIIFHRRVRLGQPVRQRQIRPHAQLPPQLLLPLDLAVLELVHLEPLGQLRDVERLVLP